MLEPLVRPARVEVGGALRSERVAIAPVAHRHSKAFEKCDEVTLLFGGEGLRSSDIAIEVGLLLPRLGKGWELGKQVVAIERNNLFQVSEMLLCQYGAVCPIPRRVGMSNASKS